MLELLGLATVLGALGFVLYLVPQIYRWRQVRGWENLSGVMALTYDDGPDKQTSLALLNLLAELDVKATFYLVGFRAELEPEMVRKLHDHGHELGTHSFYHKHAWKVPPWVDLADAKRGHRTLSPIAGDHAPYRPPFGKISLPTLISMLAHGRRVDWWTRPTNDTDDEFDPPCQVARQVIAEQQKVVLMHSHHEEPHRRDFMLETTRALVNEARQRGIRLVTMSELTAAAQVKG